MFGFIVFLTRNYFQWFYFTTLPNLVLQIYLKLAKQNDLLLKTWINWKWCCQIKYSMVLSYYLGLHIYFSQLMYHLKDAINLLLEHIWLLSSLQVKPIDNSLNLNNLFSFKFIHTCFCPILKIPNFWYISQYHLNYNFFKMVNMNHIIDLIPFYTLF